MQTAPPPKKNNGNKMSAKTPCLCGNREDRTQNEDIKVQGGPKKVSHYRESSLNRIKNRQPG